MNILFNCETCENAIICKYKDVDVPETIALVDGALENSEYNAPVLTFKLACSKYLKMKNQN